MLIRNYGLFWNQHYVFWGRQKKAGHLKGYPAKAVKQAPTNFRDQQGVYVLYDNNFKMVYVGQAGRGQQKLFERLKQHTWDPLAGRWTKFSWFGIREAAEDGGGLKPETIDAKTTNDMVLDHIEAILISAAEPPHNRQGGRFGSDVTQYLQYEDDPELKPDVEEMVRQLWDASNSK